MEEEERNRKRRKAQPQRRRCFTEHRGEQAPSPPPCSHAAPSPSVVWEPPRGNFWELCNADLGGPAQIYSIQNLGQPLPAENPHQPWWPLKGSTVLSQRWALESSPSSSSPCPLPQRGLKTPRSSASRGQLHGQGAAGGGPQAAVGAAVGDPLGSQEHPPKGATAGAWHRVFKSLSLGG